MGRLVQGIFGGGQTQRVSPEPRQELQEERGRTAAQRRKLFETEGGAAGEELEAGQVRRRDTLLGN